MRRDVSKGEGVQRRDVRHEMAAKAPKSPPKKTTKSAKSPSSKNSPSKNSKSPGASAGPTRKAAPAKAPASPKRPARPADSRGDGKSPAKAKAPIESPRASRTVFVPRAVANLDDDDVLMAHGGGGAGFGRCGGRLLSSKLEQSICHRLGLAGVVHSHSPRHYEVRFEDSRVAAYAPMVVLRGRGREGKSVVIEAAEDANAPILRKVVAFRAQYGQEFYVIFVASDDVLDAVPLATYDESCSVTNVNTLIARLSE